MEPIEAVVDKFFGSIIQNKDTIEFRIIERQISMDKPNGNSFASLVYDKLRKYTELPDLTNFNDAQVLLTIAENFASQERYQLQPTKTNTIQVKFSQRKQTDQIQQNLQLKNDNIPNVTEATHIGL